MENNESQPKKLIELIPFNKTDILKNIQNQQSYLYQHRSIVEQQKPPEFTREPIQTIEVKEPKKGLEGWYDKHKGKLALFFAILSFILGVITIIQAYLLNQK